MMAKWASLSTPVKVVVVVGAAVLLYAAMREMKRRQLSAETPGESH